MFLIKLVIFMFVLNIANCRTLRYFKSNDTSSDSQLLAHKDCNCNWRYLRHYQAKPCIPTETDECDCPKKFFCLDENLVKNKENVCFYKGKEYEVGSRMNISDPCQICKCLGRHNPRIFCIPRECPPIEARQGKNCHPVYKRNNCCPYDYKCLPEEEDVENIDQILTCEYEGKHYPLHSKIYPSDDPCLICECTENWAGVSNTSCYQQECILEKNKAYLDSGCIPIYHEKICCPVEFYCPADEELAFKSNIDNSNISIPDTPENVSQCIFAGQFYNMGHELAIDHPTKCVKCRCEIPPVFTCIHQSCPSPPNSENCFPYYNPDLCCPKYECLLGDAAPPLPSPNGDLEENFDKREMEENEPSEFSERENVCSDIKCDEGMKCMLYQVMCGNITCPPVPACLKVNNECPLSSCATNCVVIGQDENNCVSCACGEEISKHVSSLKCQMPQCLGQNCHLVAGDGGCPVCACDQPCTIPTCEPGCNVLSLVEGRCPQCVCEDETEGCPTPICEDETCRIESPPDGCPTCICDNKASESEIHEVAAQQDQQFIDQQQQQFVPQDYIETEGPQYSDSEENVDTIQIYSEKLTDEANDDRTPPTTQSGNRQP